MRSQVPKASSRDRIDRVRAKLSVVTLLLPKLHLKEGLVTNVNASKDDPGNETNSVDESVIDRVAAAQKLFDKDQSSSEEKSPNRSVGFPMPSSSNRRHPDVVSVPRSSTAFHSDTTRKTFHGLNDSRTKLSSEPVPNVLESTRPNNDEQYSKTYLELDQHETSFNKFSLPTLEQDASSFLVGEVFGEKQSSFPLRN